MLKRPGMRLARATTQLPEISAIAAAVDEFYAHTHTPKKNRSAGRLANVRVAICGGYYAAFCPPSEFSRTERYDAVKSMRACVCARPTRSTVVDDTAPAIARLFSRRSVVSDCRQEANVCVRAFDLNELRAICNAIAQSAGKHDYGVLLPFCMCSCCGWNTCVRCERHVCALCPPPPKAVHFVPLHTNVHKHTLVSSRTHSRQRPLHAT